MRNKSLNLPNMVLMAALPIVSVYGLFITELYLNTILVGLFTAITAGLSITVGYHRLFSHKSYEASKYLKYVLVLLGCQALQGSVLEWALDHRAHHRYTDSDKDPYNIKRGFWYAHVGWLFYNRDTNINVGERRRYDVDVYDLANDDLLLWQDKYYSLLATFAAFIMPTLICGVGWGDWQGGFLVAGVLSKTLVLHSTFCINSLAHYSGESTYSEKHSPKDNWLISLITFGEGYHNFHHSYSYDYRNGVNWYDYDPSKWIIWMCSKVGLAKGLKRTDKYLIGMAKVKMDKKKCDNAFNSYDWTPFIDGLDKITYEEAENLELKEWVVINGVLYNMTGFSEEHPGGSSYITRGFGKDITKIFNSHIHDHSEHARLLLHKKAIFKMYI